MLTVEGERHTVALEGINPCVNEIVADYLIRLELPANDEHCVLSADLPVVVASKETTTKTMVASLMQPIPTRNEERIMNADTENSSRPTVVLVHGAFAESSSWNGVIARLHEAGYTAVAAANPLHSLSSDAEAVAGVLESLAGPVVLVGHSYGGAVISNAARGKDSVKALVFVGAFAPEEGESIGELSGRFPGSTLGETLQSVPLPDGSADLYIRLEAFREQFAADVPAEQAVLMAATQRPLRDVALNEGSGPPAWRSVPAWFVFGEGDKNIPVAALRFMAERAAARKTVEVPNASHALSASYPGEVADVILAAAAYVEGRAR